MNKTKFSPAIKKIFSTIFVMSVISLLLVMRNPALFIHPEPWAEDMTVFISDEYNIGFPSTALIPYSGYLHLLPRIIVWIALKFDFSNAMMVINLAVLLIKVLFFLMIYKSKEITSKIIKFSLLAYLTFLPFCEEIYNNVTNLQWWLIPFLALIILKHETNVYETLFDIFMLILLGLTGVNSVMFAVPCAYLIYRAKTKTSLIKNLLVIICACIQFYFLHTSGRADTGKIMYNGGGD